MTPQEWLLLRVLQSLLHPERPFPDISPWLCSAVRCLHRRAGVTLAGVQRRSITCCFSRPQTTSSAHSVSLSLLQVHFRKCRSRALPSIQWLTGHAFFICQSEDSPSNTIVHTTDATVPFDVKSGQLHLNEEEVDRGIGTIWHAMSSMSCYYIYSVGIGF